VLRQLDALGYARFRHWKVYGEEALAGREAALRVASESLTVEPEGGRSRVTRSGSSRTPAS
jgi:hypothetical protein